MSAEDRASAIEVDGVRRLTGQQAILRLDLACGSDRCSATVHRSMNPTLFDFLAAHAERWRGTGLETEPARS